MRDVNYGWLLRYMHANGASFFFIFVYLHIGRGLYYGSYRAPRTLVWSIGVIIFILMMATAFLGLTNISPTCQLMVITMVYLVLLSNYFSNTNITDSGLVKLLNNFNLKPVIVIDNLQELSTKVMAPKLLRDLGGIYLIYNKITGEKYVGSAIVGNLYKRFYKHLYGGQGNRLVKEAVDQHGLENFVFMQLKSVDADPLSGETDKHFLLENYFLELFKPEYNIATLSQNTYGYHHTEETKQKMRDNYSNERREQIGSLNRGKNLSDETREKVRQAALRRGPMSEEHKQKSISNERPLLITDISDTSFSKAIFMSNILVAANHIGCDEKTIRRALKANGVVKKQWLVKDYLHC